MPEHIELLHNAKAAIQILHDDNTVEKGVVIESLQDLETMIEEMLDALEI